MDIFSLYPKQYNIVLFSFSITIYGWNKAAKAGRLDLGPGQQTPQTAKTLAEENERLRQENKALLKENKQLKEENEFLEEASAFFAACRRKSARN